MEDRLRQSGVLKGTFIVEFTAAVQRFGTVKHEIGSQIFNYVGSTNDQKCSSSTEVHAEGSTVGRIQKLCDQGEWIEVVGPDNRGGWMNEVEGQVSSLLAERIQSKQAALGKGNCPKPWILVLHDQYALADDSHFVSRLPWIEAANDFHTIIIIRPGIRVLALKNGFPSVSHASCQRCCIDHLLRH
ncbi:hypothetical protein B7486_10900 [cyanobacterium TDX16]|nr:hypothetical protein B7486_10900 [cyanobacterium TDX16]